MSTWERPPSRPNPHENCGLSVLAFITGLAAASVLAWKKLR